MHIPVSIGSFWDHQKDEKILIHTSHALFCAVQNLSRPYKFFLILFKEVAEDMRIRFFLEESKDYGL